MGLFNGLCSVAGVLEMFGGDRGGGRAGETKEAGVYGEIVSPEITMTKEKCSEKRKAEVCYRLLKEISGSKQQ